MPQEALKIHGLTTEFLKDKPVFSEIANKLLSFLKNGELVIHNAKFDINFLNYELDIAAKKNLDKFKIIDTLLVARKIFPGAANNLDALCRRYNIDTSKRTKHGALLDAELLADVFLEMNGGRQQGFNLNFESDKIQFNVTTKKKKRYIVKIASPDNEEVILHKKLLTKIKEILVKKKNNLFTLFNKKIIDIYKKR